MNRINNRLRRLEAERPGGGECGPVAVLEHPFPDADANAWASSLLAGFAEPAALWVLEGAELNVLLEPTLPSSIEYGSEAERAWLGASKTYPHYLIVGDGGDGLLVERFESEAHERERTRELAETANG